MFVIFGTLLPVASQITIHLHKKKFSVYAAETIYRAAIMNRAYGQTSGSRNVEGVHYDWEIDQGSICVNYELYEKEVFKCVNLNL